jgi:hypothetical protein
MPATPVGVTGGNGNTPVAGEVRISSNGRPQVATWGVNYWMWAPTYGDNVAGTETQIQSLAPRLLRIGGHNNDNNNPDPFNASELDQASAYAHAVGAEPIVQVPLLADERGAAPTADTAAALVTYANITKKYGIKYFSLGNEPDLYPDQEPTLPRYTPQDYCTSARAFVAAMKAVDPTIQIWGPDLSWKYQPGFDWLTPILTNCGDLFDVVTFHRYPFAPTEAFASNASVDVSAFGAVIEQLRGILRATGQGNKPLALTETNITYDGAPEKSTLDASPGTVPAALWAADMLGTALREDLFTTLFWSISEGWTLGMLTASHTARPVYHALRLFAEHFGPTLVDVTATPSGVRVYASRNAGGTALIVVNWNETDQAITFTISRAMPASARFTLGARTVSAVEFPDTGQPVAFSYGQAQYVSGAGPEQIAPVP